MSRELTPQETAERSLIKTYRKSIWNPFIAAVKRYEPVSYTHLTLPTTSRV